MIMSLVKLKPTVLRGNASEILAVAGAAGTVKGVDSTIGSDAALEAGKRLAKEFGIVVAISGEKDLVRIMLELFYFP
jgi:hydroxyethylthiazole kinase-like sugar kinase family protein